MSAVALSVSVYVSTIVVASGVRMISNVPPVDEIVAGDGLSTNQVWPSTVYVLVPHASARLEIV